MGFGGTGGGSGSGSISGAADVALSNPADSQLLGYDSSSSKWVNLPSSDASLVAIRSVTASTTLVLGDTMNAVEVNASGATTVTVPPQSSVAFPIGTVIEVAQLGTGSVTIAAGSGVTLQSAGALLATRAQYSTVSIRKRATNTWLVVGDVA